MQPEHEEEHPDGEEDVDEYVRLRDQEASAETRDDQHEHDRRPEQPRGRVTVQAARDRGHRTRDEEPELEMERDRVDAPHRVECRGVEDRQDAADTSARRSS